MTGRHAVILTCTLLAAAGCDQSAANMGRQPKANTYAQSTFFADGASARPTVAGTIARDGDVNDQPAGHGDDKVVPLDQRIPMPITRDLLERGQTAYDVSCSVCHGRLGNGDGMIAQRGFTRPPSFHVDRLKASPDAHFYNVITHGYGAMFSYNDRVTPDDRWAIVAYIRALQSAPDSATLAADDRATLLIGGDPNAPKGGAR